MSNSKKESPCACGAGLGLPDISCSPEITRISSRLYFDGETPVDLKKWYSLPVEKLPRKKKKALKKKLQEQKEFSFEITYL